MCEEGTFAERRASVGDAGGEDCAPERLCPLDKSQAERVVINMGDETRLTDRGRK